MGVPKIRQHKDNGPSFMELHEVLYAYGELGAAVLRGDTIEVPYEAQDMVPSPFWGDDFFDLI